MTPFMFKSASFKSFWPIRSRFFCILAFLIFSFFASFSQLKEVHSFEKEWLIYQSNWKVFLPYISNKHFSYHSKSLLLDFKSQKATYIRIQPIDDYYLFINGAYRTALEKDSVYVYSLDSLSKNYPGQSSLLLTFFKENLSGLPGKISLVRKISLVNQANTKEYASLERLSKLKSDFIGISLFAILILLAIIHYYFPKYFYTYFQYTDWIHWRFKDNVIQNSPFSFPNLLVLLTLSFLTAFIGFLNLSSNPNYLLSQLDAIDDASPAIWVLSRTFFAFVLFSGRFFVYEIFTSIFKIEFLSKPHFYKSIQTNMQFFSLFFLVLVLLSLYYGPSFQPNLPLFKALVFGYFFVRIIYFFQLFRGRFTINVFTLAAYLIIIEGQVILFGINQILFPEMS